jgi:hypothetical protein
VLHFCFGSRGSSISVISDYVLGDRTIEVRSPAEETCSPCLCAQRAHPTSYPTGIGCPFPGGENAAGAWSWPLTPIKCRGREWVGAIPPVLTAPPGCEVGLLYLVAFWTLMEISITHTQGETRSRFHLENLIVAHLVKKLPVFHGTEGYFRVHTSPCPKPDESTQHTPTQPP